MVTKDFSQTTPDPKTHSRIIEHILNKQDVITDEDIQNAQTNFGDNSSATEINRQETNEITTVSDEQKLEERTVKENTNPEDTQSAWNILGD